MANLTTTQVLDDALLNIQDNSSTMRSRFLNWLNNAIQDIALERDWNCLRISVDVTINNGVITKPADYDRTVEIKNQASDTNYKWCVTTQHKLSDVEAAFVYNRLDYACPTWYETDTEIIFSNVFSPTAATLVYIPQFSTYAEGDTIPFPASYSNYFQRAILTTYYEWDMDERAGFSQQQLEKSLKQLKHAENQLVNARAGWSTRYGTVNTDAR